jgi:hypothetical protein
LRNYTGYWFALALAYECIICGLYYITSYITVGGWLMFTGLQHTWRWDTSLFAQLIIDSSSSLASSGSANAHRRTPAALAELFAV